MEKAKSSKKWKVFLLFLGMIIGGIVVSIPWYFAWDKENMLAKINLENLPESVPPELIPLSNPIELNECDLNSRFENIHGDEFHLSDFSGKVILLNYWATWCGPCVKEFPSLDKLQNRYKGNDRIAFLFLSDESLDKIKNFAKKERAFKNLTFYKYELDNKPCLFRSRGIPTTLIINAKNEVILKHTGMTDWNSQKVHDMIDNLLADIQGYR